MFKPHGWSRFTYQFETYSTSVMIILLLFHLKRTQRTIDYCDPPSTITTHRLIASSYQSSYAWGATRCLLGLSAPACCRRIRPKAYCFQRCLPPAKSLVDDILSTLVPLVWARIWRAHFSLFSHLRTFWSHCSLKRRRTIVQYSILPLLHSLFFYSSSSSPFKVKKEKKNDTKMKHPQIITYKRTMGEVILGNSEVRVTNGYTRNIGGAAGADRWSWCDCKHSCHTP